MKKKDKDCIYNKTGNTYGAYEVQDIHVSVPCHQLFRYALVLHYVGFSRLMVASKAETKLD